MALSNPPINVAPLDTGYLSAGISASATTITVAPIYKYPSGVKTKQGFDSTQGGICLIQLGDKVERISYDSASVNATTKVTTLSTCVRGLSMTSTSTSLTAGTGLAWPKGAKITVVQDVSYIQHGTFLIGSQTATQAGDTITANGSATNFASTIAIPANLLAAGDILDIHCSGYMTPTDSFLFLYRFGTTALVTNNTITHDDSVQYWEARIRATVRSVSGTTTTIMAGGYFFYNNSVPGNDRFLISLRTDFTGAPDPITLDSTAALTATPRVTWGGGSSSITMQQHQVIITKN